MNEEECDDLAASYNTIIADGAQLIQDAVDRTVALKADAYIIKGEDDETFEEFKLRFKSAFDEYVPIPTIPDVDFTELPGTCQQSTKDARADLTDFIGLYSMHLTYEDWVANELKECCADLVLELTSAIDQDRTDDLDAVKADILADLYTLQGDESVTAEDFEADTQAEFDAADVEDIETGIERPTVPESCTDLTPAIVDANSAFNAWADTIQTCENQA